MAPVSEFPPPSGRPVAYALIGDPWAEQARRHERHRAEQARRRRRVLLSVAGAAVVVAAVGVTAFLVVGADSSSNSSTDASQVRTGTTLPASAIPASAGSSSDGTESSGDREQAAKVVDVWLLDRGDGNFDWGAVLSSNADVVRGDLEVSVVALDDDGVEIFADRVAVPRLAPDGLAAVGGAFNAGDRTPTRVEVTATLGTALPDEAGAIFAVSAVRRVASGQVGRDDRLLGTIELVAGNEAPVRLAVIWRDDEGRVVASVFDELGPVSTEAAAEFSLRLPRNLVPLGEPDSIVASVGASE
jgi:hypothetical protein